LRTRAIPERLKGVHDEAYTNRRLPYLYLKARAAITFGEQSGVELALKNGQ